MRRTITAVVAVAGVSTMVIAYFVLAAPWGSSAERFSNPRVPFAAGIFIAGLIALIAAALVYELTPDRRRRR